METDLSSLHNITPVLVRPFNISIHKLGANLLNTRTRLIAGRRFGWFAGHKFLDLGQRHVAKLFVVLSSDLALFEKEISSDCACFFVLRRMCQILSTKDALWFPYGVEFYFQSLLPGCLGFLISSCEHMRWCTGRINLHVTLGARL